MEILSSKTELNTVSGGGITGFVVAYTLSKGIDSYIDWVSSGAGGWEVEYNGIGYNDPLL